MVDCNCQLSYTLDAVAEVHAVFHAVLHAVFHASCVHRATVQGNQCISMKVNRAVDIHVSHLMDTVHQ